MYHLLFRRMYIHKNSSRNYSLYILSTQIIRFAKKIHGIVGCSLSWVADCESIIDDLRFMNPHQLIDGALHSLNESEFSCTTTSTEELTSNSNDTRDVKRAEILILLMAATLLLVLGVFIAVMLKRSDLMKRSSWKWFHLLCKSAIYSWLCQFSGGYPFTFSMHKQGEQQHSVKSIQWSMEQ